VTSNKLLIRNWGTAWISLAIAIALHVIDEALTDFLPLYNSVVQSLRESYSWIPLPTFSFQTWITGLSLGVLILLGLSPLVFAGNRVLRPLSYILGILMVANALGHVGMSIYLAELAPGVYSSPILLLAALALLITTYRCRETRLH
jgi:zinc transporter ZupT